MGEERKCENGRAKEFSFLTTDKHSAAELQPKLIKPQRREETQRRQKDGNFEFEIGNFKMEFCASRENSEA
jgi:hypothetical protein